MHTLLSLKELFPQSFESCSSSRKWWKLICRWYCSHPALKGFFKITSWSHLKGALPVDLGQMLFVQIRKFPRVFDYFFFPELRIIQTELTCNGFCRENSESFIPKAMAIGFQNFAQNTLCKKWRNISNRVMLIFQREFDLGKGQEGASRLESTDICLI